MTIDLGEVPGFRWQENGQSVLWGWALERIQSLDRLFLRWAKEYAAEEYSFPAFIAASELQKLDYFRSFPHLVTFPVALDAAPESLRLFSLGAAVGEDGGVRLGACAPVREVLTPAACYHLYIHLQGITLPAARTFTTAATCVRREESYHPLRRQWSFTMREIVGLGNAEEVKDFLSGFQDRLSRFFEDIGLPVVWRQATDSFFDPSHNAKFLAQKIDPVKTEIVFGEEEVAIGSINFHRNFFGETFGIRRGGEAAFSGCVAFGLERWLFAFLSRFGTDERAWPAPVEGG